jgi:hypothetical protein
LHLTIKGSTTGDTTALVCDDFTWYGIDYTTSGTPTHILTNSVGCDSTLTLNLTIEDCTGIKENLNNLQVLIYPNPATNNLTIETSPQAIIEITNIQGQLIKTIVAIGNKTTIDVSALPSGVYVVEVNMEKGVEVKKFVKE